MSSTRRREVDPRRTNQRAGKQAGGVLGITATIFVAPLRRHASPVKVQQHSPLRDTLAAQEVDRRIRLSQETHVVEVAHVYCCRVTLPYM